RPRRDTRGDSPHRQRAPDHQFHPGAGDDHLGRHRQRVHGGRRRSLHLVADSPRTDHVPDHLHHPGPRQADAPAHAAPGREVGMDLYRRRRATNYAALAVAMAAAAFGLFWLIAILWTLLYNGISAINIALFTEMTPPPGSAGGLLHAIFRSLVLTIGGTLLGTPIGMMAGTYLAEYGKTNGLAQ